jgi:hypothetical protein
LQPFGMVAKPTQADSPSLTATWSGNAGDPGWQGFWRSSEGRSTREIRCCIKRYIARELYRTLTRAMTAPATA